MWRAHIFNYRSITLIPHLQNAILIRAILSLLRFQSKTMPSQENSHYSTVNSLSRSQSSIEFQSYLRNSIENSFQSLFCNRKQFTCKQNGTNLPVRHTAQLHVTATLHCQVLLAEHHSKLPSAYTMCLDKWNQFSSRITEGFAKPITMHLTDYHTIAHPSITFPSN